MCPRSVSSREAASTTRRCTTQGWLANGVCSAILRPSVDCLATPQQAVGGLAMAAGGLNNFPKEPPSLFLCSPTGTLPTPQFRLRPSAGRQDIDRASSSCRPHRPADHREDLSRRHRSAHPLNTPVQPRTANFSSAARSISIPSPGPVGTATTPSTCSIGAVSTACRNGCSERSNSRSGSRAV